MTNDFGYVDPVQRAHGQRAEWAASQSPCPAPVQAPQPVQSPLANLPQAQAEIFEAAGMPQYRNVREDMVVGAILSGLLGWMFSRRRQRKAQRLQELKESLGVSDVE
jgi:hypothetical protein